jgi:hypothetical protein
MQGHVIRILVPTPQSPHSPGSTFQRVHMKPDIVIIVIQNLWPPESDTVVLGYITVNQPTGHWMPIMTYDSDVDEPHLS